MISRVSFNSVIEFDYKNHRGSDERRSILYNALKFGTIEEFYPEPTLLMTGYCYSRKCIRAFDVTKMRNISVRDALPSER